MGDLSREAVDAALLKKTAEQREELLAAWRRLMGSTMPPIATHVGVCPECHRKVGARGRDGAWTLNEHDALLDSPAAGWMRFPGFRCNGSGRAVKKVEALP